MKSNERPDKLWIGECGEFNSRAPENYQKTELIFKVPKLRVDQSLLRYLSKLSIAMES